jgi:hypothetical protein
MKENDGQMAEGANLMLGFKRISSMRMEDFSSRSCAMSKTMWVVLNERARTRSCPVNGFHLKLLVFIVTL